MRRTTLLSGLAVATIFSLAGCGNSHSTPGTAPVAAKNQSSPQSTNTQTNVTSNNTTSSTTSSTSVTSSTSPAGQPAGTNTANASNTSGSAAANSSSPAPASTSPNNTGGTAPASTTPVNSNVAGHSKLAATMKQLLGNPKNGPVDCSALVQYVYAQSGYKLPRTVKEQATVGTKISSKSQLKYGDVVFFDLSAKPNVSTFDGIYVGNGQFVAKTTHGIMSVSLNSNYWNSKFLFGQQILN